MMWWWVRVRCVRFLLSAALILLERSVLIFGRQVAPVMTREQWAAVGGLDAGLGDHLAAEKAKQKGEIRKRRACAFYFLPHWLLRPGRPAPRADFGHAMSTLFISQYRLVEDSSIKPHYVYVVEILHVGKRYSVEKRYSAFHSLHREVPTPIFSNQ